jgi:hypothetical protein
MTSNACSVADEDPDRLLKFSPPKKKGGHKIESEIGDVVHVLLSRFAETSTDLHPGFKRRGKEGKNYVVDLFHLSPDQIDPTNIEAKVNTDSGRSRGSKQSLDYKSHSGQETVVLLYDLTPAQWAKVDKLNRKVTDLWNEKNPEWRRAQTSSNAVVTKKSKNRRRTKGRSRRHAKDETTSESSPPSCRCP